MAFTNSAFNDSRIRVIAFQDDAVTCDRADYEKYLENLDETLLGLKDVAPTRFVMRKFLDQREVTGVMDSMVSVAQDQSMNVKLSSSMEEVRRALVDIETPAEVQDGLVWKKDSGDKWADKDLVAKLNQYGIIPDLATARKNAMGKGKGLELVKKS